MKILKIDNCQSCPHLNIGMEYSLDGFDSGKPWFCKLLNRQIYSWVEWNEPDKMPIPEDCPLDNFIQK